MTELSVPEFYEVFDRFAASPTSRSVFRWEALQTYNVPDVDVSLVAYRTGAPRPERSIRTDEWLARVARSTLAGKDWIRVRYVEESAGGRLTEYTDWELLAHAEAQAAGDRILINLAKHSDETDFWLFTGEHPSDNCAVLMYYDDAGAPTAFCYTDDPGQLAILAAARDAVLEGAMPLNDYLARRREVLGAR